MKATKTAKRLGSACENGKDKLSSLAKSLLVQLVDGCVKCTELGNDLQFTIKYKRNQKGNPVHAQSINTQLSEGAAALRELQDVWKALKAMTTSSTGASASA